MNPVRVFSQRKAMRRKRFDPLKEILDLVALGIEVGIEGRLDRAGRVCLDMGLGAQSGLDQGPQVARVIGCIRDGRGRRPRAPQSRRGLRAVAAVPRRRDQPHRQSQCVHCRVEFRRQTAARASDPLSLSPPLAPVASAWVLQIVLSMRMYSKSGSALNSIEKALPDPRHHPSPEPRMHPGQFAELGRQIAPGRGRSRQPKHRIHKEPVVGAAPPPANPRARKMPLDPRPLRVAQCSSAQDRLRFRS